MGVRVRPSAVERVGIEAHAEALDVRYPFDGDALRLVMGVCVFYDDGCRLHAAFGEAAKPAVCRQFPHVRAGDLGGVDPACAHWTAFSEAPAELGLETEGPTLSGTLRQQGEALELGLGEVGEMWRTTPWSAWEDSAAAGPLRRAGVADLRRLAVPTGWPSWDDGARAVAAVSRLRLSDFVGRVWAGAVVIGAAEASLREKRGWLAVWVRGHR